MPRPPRPTSYTEEVPEQPEVHVDIEDVEEEEIVIEPEDDIKKKPKKKFFNFKKTTDDEEVLKPSKTKDTSSSVNVQATGNVYNIVNSSKVRFGNDYYLSPPSKTTNQSQSEEHIEKDNLITLLMEATIKPDHDYIDYISKNLGRNWHTFFRSLGFSQGRIETAEIDAGAYGICEARYKLLLDWVNNDDDGTLGGLTKKLWEEGERSTVKALSAMYKKSKK
ncbi:unnamed protein product [Arctia plantaginis]|uniref:Death domain-containing protein n=1 Tax=Arctia plantaginis TaxID=874455 RepID=A0A8S1B9V8_ARCPL|nr:unnamed protein product [Arctia plantaginis]